MAIIDMDITSIDDLVFCTICNKVYMDVDYCPDCDIAINQPESKNEEETK